MPSQAQGAFSLFPSPDNSKPPSALRTSPHRGRRSDSRERRAPTPQGEHGAGSLHPHHGPALVSAAPVVASTENMITSHSNAQQGQQGTIPIVQPELPTSQGPFRNDTSAPQVSSGGSVAQLESLPVRRSSIAKLPLYDEAETSSTSAPQQPLQSMFPTYNHDLPLNQQDYAPTQLSPTHIPRAVISRQMYHRDEEADEISHVHGMPRGSSPLRSPLSAGSAEPWSGRPGKAPNPPAICTTEELRSLWKVTNGWKAGSSEGKVYSLKLTQEQDAPVYTLSSSTQPFYNVRLDPTSTSAHVTVARHDPAKEYKPSRSDASSSDGDGANGGVSVKAEGKHWHQVMATSLEEESRRRPPNDGLVAMLMPSPAVKVAVEKAHEPQAVMVAEREYARLVWDEDSRSHFLVHQALAVPFCVTIERTPGWSRVEYTLEHHESPQHVAKLTRDGTGAGWLEIDTGIASKIESFYMIDVAVTALMLVAAGDEKNLPAVEPSFEPPPAIPAAAVLSGGGRSSLDRASQAAAAVGEAVSAKLKLRPKMEVFELDVESQESLGKGGRGGKRGGIFGRRRKGVSEGKKEKSVEDDKLPFVIRVVVKVLKGVFKVFIWVLTIGFKCVMLGVKGVYKCIGSKY